MFWSVIFALVALAEGQFGGGGSGSGRTALLRFGCSKVVIDRIDPLVNPGVSPSPHVHQVVGGNAFNISIPATDVSSLATCTTCSFSEDLSNYWTANVYFKARNGSYKRVPQIPNRFLDGSQGGMTIYYVSPGPREVTAFKPGFRMLFGDAMRRTRLGSGLKTQSCFRCFTGPDFEGDVYSPCMDPVRDTETFPATACFGIRSNIHFPTCWDGKNLDTPNHQDHVAYPISGPSSFVTTAKCPDSHPVKIPQLMLEIVWDTTKFNDPNLWPEDGSQPLVLSTGDPTGYGQHGDYVFGWKGDSLQRAMDGGCFGPICDGVETQRFDVANKCSVETRVNEDMDGWLDKLPGDGTGA